MIFISLDQVPLMKGIVKALIRSHLFLSTCSFVFLFGLYHEYENSFIYSFMISMGIIGVYNGHRLWKLNKGRLPDTMHNWTLLNKNPIFILTIISTLSAVMLYFIFFSGNILRDVLTVICVVISVFYVKRFGRFSLREIPYMKVFFVIFIWYLLFFIFPFMIFKVSQPWILSFLLLLIILIPSDIKDVYFDNEKMRTIPQVIGLYRSVILIQLLIAVSIFILFFQRDEIQNALAWLLGFCYFFSMTLVFKKIGYKYFFVFADFIFMIIGTASVFLKCL